MSRHHHRIRIPFWIVIVYCLLMTMWIRDMAGAETSVETMLDRQVTAPADGEDCLAFDDPALTTLSHGRLPEASARWLSPATAEAGRRDDVRVFEVVVPRSSPQAWDAQVSIPLQRKIAKGDRVLLMFDARCVASDNESSTGYAGLFVQPHGEDDRTRYPFNAGPQWQRFAYPFVAPVDHDVDQTKVVIHVASMPQTLQFAAVRLINYGSTIPVRELPTSKFTYPGRDDDAQWRTQALQRIDRIRKADMTIRVIDTDGNPVAGQKVRIRQQRHSFPFGSAVNSMLLGGDASDFPFQRYIRGDSRGRPTTIEDARRYREIVQRYLTRVTFEGALRPHVWQWGKNPGDRKSDLYRRQQVLLNSTVPWLQENRISIRGHYIGWGSMNSPPIQRDFVDDVAAHKQWLWKHMQDILPATESFVDEWDTINHVVGFGQTYHQLYGDMQIDVDIMREARRLAPSLRHAINEGQILPGGSRRDAYQAVIENLNQHGQAPDVVGFMGHFDSASLTSPPDILALLDRYAKLCPHLQLTELDVDTGTDEALQADYLRDVMIASFSHPNIDAIVMWGFWENQHWKPNAALWRSDWSRKPAGDVFVDLVRNQWWTDTTVVTEADGSATVRGFMGDYQLSVGDVDSVTSSTASGVTSVVLDKKGATVDLMVP
ncbi:Endo-1,4-beta-xylanase Z precursor [Crateriforma conspicua]|uniref:endo-1,4-beta-xylanase n=1 Tax=Crateriforma conspicua TaxID=2527996 RepID=A0A5C6FYZ1_9PLAN|nr:endo-1,4-beta-xylanase [Crateriforma conspicua]TWU66588.1 Endo-1,4-beta-xylanase Z precursor [Crateriforma conspicua]